MPVDPKAIESARRDAEHFIRCESDNEVAMLARGAPEKVMRIARALLAAAQDRAEVVEADRIMAKTDDEIMADALAEFGSAEAISAEAERIRSMMLKTVADHMAPTPDPVVMRDYIDRLTRFSIDRPEWVALAEEARGYIGAISPRGEREGK